jgi:prophage regulatory protein
MKDDSPSSGRDRIIGSAERRRLLPFSDMHIWRLEKAGQFPQRIKIGEHRVGWALNEILDWIEAHKSRRGRS